MLMLSSELMNETSSIHVRNAAGLALKNALTARVKSLHPVSSVSLLFNDFDTRRRHDKMNTLLDGLP
jgi:importin subunit beta-1